MDSILAGVIVGVTGTVTMDILATISRKLDLSAGAKGEWVGRWYLGIARGHFVHSNIAISPKQSGEVRVALVGHYVIGITLAVLYVLGVRAVGLSPSSFFSAVGYGLATCIFPWFMMFPAMGFGLFGRNGTPEFRLFTTSLMNHFFYGLGLWWISMLLHLD